MEKETPIVQSPLHCKNGYANAPQLCFIIRYFVRIEAGGNHSYHICLKDMTILRIFSPQTRTLRPLGSCCAVCMWVIILTQRLIILPLVFMGNVVRDGFSVGARYYFSVFQNVCAGCGAHPASYLVDMGFLF